MKKKNRLSLFALFVSQLAVFATGACVVEHSAESDASTAGTCTPGTWFCEDNVAKRCGDLGYVVERVECYAPQHCVVDSCQNAPDGGWPDTWRPDTRPRDAGLSDQTRPDSNPHDSGIPDVSMPDWSLPDFGFPDLSSPDLRQPDTTLVDVDAGYNCEAIDDSYESNDTSSQARELLYNTSSGNEVSGLIACDEEDWYFIDLSNTDGVEVTLTIANSPDSDLDVYLYEPNGSSAFDSGATTDAVEVASYYGSAPELLIRIDNYTYPQVVGEYSLSFAPIPAPVCGDGEVTANERCDTAIASGSTGACPTSCSTANCSVGTLVSGGTCDAHCENSNIETCRNNDECCPDSCSAQSDNNCPSTWTACNGDNDCLAEQYCDLARELPVCKSGCRLSSPNICDAEHDCALDHRCVLNQVVAHERCSSCSDNDPCNEGFTCGLFGTCTASCNLLLDDCATLVGPGESCLIYFCSQSDCP